MNVSAAVLLRVPKWRSGAVKKHYNPPAKCPLVQAKNEYTHKWTCKSHSDLWRRNAFLPVTSKRSCVDCPLWACTTVRCSRTRFTRQCSRPGVTGRFTALLATAGRNSTLLWLWSRKVAKIVQCGEIFRKATLKRVAFSFGYRSRHKQNQFAE